jgi:UDPglucose 6-dehydrogenase
VLGLSFKPGTDDLREAPAIEIVQELLKEGVRVKVYDPVAMAKAKVILKNSVKFCKDAYETAKDSDCLMVATEWNEFKELDFKRIKKLMKQAVIADGRNIYDPAEMKKLGFRYVGIGRG